MRIVLPHHLNMAAAIDLAVAIVTSLGGLWFFWAIVDGADFVRRGYRIEQLPPTECWRWTPGPKAYVYEEWSSEDGLRRLPFIREVLGGGYPAPSVLHLPNADTWDAVVPAWARGRREKIAQRISDCAGIKTHIGAHEAH